MTKHNAEMENSREQSRVCARLPLNLQLFAEDTGENGADTNAEGAAGSTGARQLPTKRKRNKFAKNMTPRSARWSPWRYWASLGC